MALTVQHNCSFQRQYVLQQILLTVRTLFQISFTAAYSGPHADFHTTVYETEI